MASRPAGKRAASEALEGSGPLAKRARLEESDALSVTLEATVVATGREAAVPVVRDGMRTGGALAPAFTTGDTDDDDAGDSDSVVDSVISYSSMPPLVPAATFSRPHGASTDTDESEETGSGVGSSATDDARSGGDGGEAGDGVLMSQAVAVAIVIEEEEGGEQAVAVGAAAAAPTDDEDDDGATVPNSDTESAGSVGDARIDEDEPDDEDASAVNGPDAASSSAASGPSPPAAFDARLVAASTELDAFDDVHLPVIVDVDADEEGDLDDGDAAAADLDGAAIVHALLRSAAAPSQELPASVLGADVSLRPFRLLPQPPLDADDAAHCVLRACDTTRSLHARREALLSLLAAPTSEHAAAAMATAAADGSRYPLQPRPSAATPRQVLQQLRGLARPTQTAASSSSAAELSHPPLASMFVMAAATLLLPLDVDTAVRLAPALAPLLAAFLAGPAPFDSAWSACTDTAQPDVGLHTQPAFSLSEDSADAVDTDTALSSSVTNVMCYLALLHVFSMWQRQLTAALPTPGSLRSALRQDAATCLDRLVAAVGRDSAGALTSDDAVGASSSSSGAASGEGGGEGCGAQDLSLPPPPAAAAAVLAAQLRVVSGKLTAAAGALVACEDPQPLLASWARHQHGLLCAELTTTGALHAACLSGGALMHVA